MIDRSAMMPAIVRSCQEFAAAYDSFATEWGDKPDTPYYLALADFTRYLIALLESGDRRKELDSAFEVIESLLSEGDQYVREAATVGILESLQNTNLHSRTTPEQFVEYLRPLSLRYWRQAEDFWENGSIITVD